MTIFGCSGLSPHNVVLLLVVILTPNHAYSGDVNVDASVVARAAVSVSATQNVSFGEIEFDPTHDATVILGTDGGISIGGGASGVQLVGGSHTPASLNLNGDGISMADVSCVNTAVLSDGAGETVSLTNIEIAVDTGVASGSGISCLGLGANVSTVDFSITPAPVFLIGGILDLSSNALSASTTYSTSNAGGSPITFRVIYQ